MILNNNFNYFIYKLLDNECSEESTLRSLTCVACNVTIAAPKSNLLNVLN